jgi:hypothetical protein
MSVLLYGRPSLTRANRLKIFGFSFSPIGEFRNSSRDFLQVHNNEDAHVPGNSFQSADYTQSGSRAASR